MRLSIFIGVLVVATLAVGVGSFMAEASSWTIVWRMVLVCVALQLAYFLLVVITAIWPAKPADENGKADLDPSEEPTPVSALDPGSPPHNS